MKSLSRASKCLTSIPPLCLIQHDTDNGCKREVTTVESPRFSLTCSSIVSKSYVM